MEDSDLIALMGLDELGRARFRTLIPRKNQYVHPDYRFGNMQPFDIGLCFFINHFLGNFARILKFFSYSSKGLIKLESSMFYMEFSNTPVKLSTTCFHDFENIDVIAVGNGLSSKDDNLSDLLMRHVY